MRYQNAEPRSVQPVFCQCGAPDSPQLFYNLIAPQLDRTSFDYWNAGKLLGGRRIDAFADGFYTHGLLGRFIALGHFLARVYGVDVSRFTKCETVEEQVALFEAEVAPLFKKRFVRFLTSKRLALFGLGIPPAQYEALCGPDGDMANVLEERTRKLCCDFPIKDNYFAWQAFARRYDDGADASLPPYLQADQFETVKKNSKRLAIRNENFTEHLARLPEASRDGYVLLDAQDWMNDEQLNALWSEITRTAKLGARVIFRTAAEPSLLPGRVIEPTLTQWDYAEAQSRDLTKRDRSAIYGGFHLYVKRG